MVLKNVVAASKQFPERNAFNMNDTYFTYQEFFQKVNDCCYYIREALNGKKQQRIAVLAYNDIETYASIFAIWCTNNIFVPLNHLAPQQRNDEIIKQADINLLLSSRVADGFVVPKNIISGSSTDLQERNNNFVLDEPADEDISYLFFTSGSTGNPKGVPVSWGNLNAFIDAFFAMGFSVDEKDRYLQMFDLTFDLSVMSYVVPLCTGACVYTVNPGAIKYMEVYRLLEEKEISFALMVPSILSYLRPYFQDIDLEKLRYSLFCGEALYNDIIGEWSESCSKAEIFNVYGPTECTIFCLYYKWDKLKTESKNCNGIVSIGKPMKHVETIVVDETNKSLTNNEKGELCLSGKLLTDGYWRNPEKNKKSFFNDSTNKRFYRTGDVSFVDDDDDRFFCGRIDSQVQIQGFRVELQEIEWHAKDFSGITNIAAIAFRNKIGNMQIHLFVENYKEELSTIIDYLKSKLPPYMIPESWSNVSSFPLNANGKTDRKALQADCLNNNI